LRSEGKRNNVDVTSRTMLLQMEGRTPQQTKDINDLIGKPYSLFERISLGGTGSPRMIISEASSEIAELLNRNVDTNYANIALRRNGIVFGFQVQQKAWGWIIPYRKLTLFKSAGSLRIHADGLKISLVPSFGELIDQAFIRKLQTFMTNYFESVKGPMDE